MRVSSTLPNAVFPDTEPGRLFAQMFFPTKRDVTEAGVVFCGQYRKGPDGRLCDRRSPAPDYIAPKDGSGRRFGCEFNWCTRCSAGFMQEELLGIDIRSRERVGA